MRAGALLLSIFAAALTVAAVACSARGADKDPPAVMEQLDLARLDAASAHIAEIQARARAESAPYELAAREICERYRIDCAELGRSITIDKKTGAITRPPSTKPAK